jgi:hypothetical protein
VFLDTAFFQRSASQLQQDNSASRLLDVFFYGLYQDSSILAEHAVPVRQARRAVLANYQLRLGNNGSLQRCPGAATPGLLLALTHAEIERLYAGAGLHQYRAEAVLVLAEDGALLPALCYITLEPAAADEQNPAYAERLRQVMTRWQLPTAHIS